MNVPDLMQVPDIMNVPDIMQVPDIIQIPGIMQVPEVKFIVEVNEVEAGLVAVTLHLGAAQRPTQADDVNLECVLY